MLLKFGTGSYQSRSLPISAQRMINCYLEIAPPGSKSPVAVVSSYGILSWCSTGSTGQAARGGTVINGVPYVVTGPSLYRINSDRTATLLGMVPGSGPVFVAGDGINIAVSADGPTYLYNGSTVSQISDPDFPGASWVGFLDGFIPIIEPGSGRIWVNETPYVPANWNALDFTTAEAAPDDLLTGIIAYRELYAFGRETIEVFYNSGNADFPLARTSGGLIEMGLLSRYGPAKADNSIMFPGTDCIVYRLNGYQPERISTHAVEKAIEDYTDKTCYGSTWTEGGHKFYALSFAQGTWVYDISTQLWHERQSTGRARWRPQFSMRAYDQTLVADYSSGEIGYLDPDVFTEWGSVLRASCTAPSISDENREMFHASLELQFEQGVGTLSTPDPQVMLDWSDDGGRTWSSEHWRSLGEMGAYKSRATWRRMGRSRDRVPRYAISDPVRRTLVRAIWQGD